VRRAAKQKRSTFKQKRSTFPRVIEDRTPAFFRIRNPLKRKFAIAVTGSPG
jgi:hypothetical protein